MHNGTLFLPLQSSSFVMSKSSSNDLTVAPIEVEFVTKSSSNESLFLPLRLSNSRIANGKLT